MEKISALRAVELAQVGATGGVTGGAPGAGPTGSSPSATSTESSVGRSGFDAAMRAAEQRANQTFDVVPQQATPFAAPDIGTGLHNIARSFVEYKDRHTGPDLKRILNADPLDPNFTIDFAAYGMNSTVSNLHFTVAAKMAGQTSKNLDTLFKSS